VSKGDVNLAEKDLAEVERALPEYATLHVVRAYLFSARGERDQAVDALNKALELSPGFLSGIRPRWERGLFKDSRIHWPTTSEQSSAK
jgi:hypothetical protein